MKKINAALAKKPFIKSFTLKWCQYCQDQKKDCSARKLISVNGENVCNGFRGRGDEDKQSN